MRIIPAKFQPSGTKGVGGDRGDRRTQGRHAHFPANAMRILPPPSLRSGGIKIFYIFFKYIFIA